MSTKLFFFLLQTDRWKMEKEEKAHKILMDDLSSNNLYIEKMLKGYKRFIILDRSPPVLDDRVQKEKIPNLYFM